VNVIYSNEPFKNHSPSIFLAGPTVRRQDLKSWRPKAIEFLIKELEFKGAIYVPEWNKNLQPVDYLTQVEWEHLGLENATYISRTFSGV